MIVFLWFSMVFAIIIVSFVFLGFTVRSWSRDKKAALALAAAGGQELNKHEGREISEK
jgi:hypothetical protein